MKVISIKRVIRGSSSWTCVTPQSLVQLYTRNATFADKLQINNYYMLINGKKSGSNITMDDDNAKASSWF